MTSISPTFALQAHTLLEGGQPVEAISLCEQGIELYPDYTTAYTVLAKAYRLTGDIRAAVESIERGLQRMPLDRSLLRLHSQMRHPASEQIPGAAPEPEQPEIELPEPEQPEIELPEPEQPEIELPEPEQPEIELPEPEQPQERNTVQPTSAEQPATAPQLFTAVPGGIKLVQAHGNGHHAPQRHTHLRVIESAGESSDMPSLIWRSRNVRLIPGLEFTPLRFESKKDKLYRRTYKIPDPPPFPDFPVEKKKAIRLQPEESRGNLTPLEELARRLEAARIPRVEEEESHPVIEPTTDTERRPAMVSETIARIYEMQGATQEAIRAYEALARQKPDQADVYLKKARELKNKD